MLVDANTSLRGVELPQFVKVQVPSGTLASAGDARDLEPVVRIEKQHLSPDGSDPQIGEPRIPCHLVVFEQLIVGDRGVQQSPLDDGLYRTTLGDDLPQTIEELGIEVAVIAGLSQVAGESTIRTQVGLGEHPCEPDREPGVGPRTQHRVLQIVADVAHVLVLHRADAIAGNETMAASSIRGVPVTVVVGGQYGSEGKGKVAHYLSKAHQAAAAVRVGGPNSGHTAVDPDGRIIVLRALPTAALLPDVLCVVGPGSYVDVDLLLEEIAQLGLAPSRVLVDYNAFVVTADDRRAERDARLTERIGSTGSGTGAAVQRRAARAGPATMARHERQLTPYLGDSVARLRSLCRAGARVIIEGTQGFGLSVLHAEHWPKATSRDVTAAAALAEAGLSPLDVDEVVLVLRAFPIRVAGASGPMGAEELTWEQVAAEAGLPSGLVERTSVTSKVRRVSRFDDAIVRRAIAANNPTTVVVNHLDYVDGSAAATARPTERILAFVEDLEERIGRRIDLLGFSPVRLTPRIGSRAPL